MYKTQWFAKTGSGQTNTTGRLAIETLALISLIHLYIICYVYINDIMQDDRLELHDRRRSDGAATRLPAKLPLPTRPPPRPVRKKHKTTPRFCAISLARYDKRSFAKTGSGLLHTENSNNIL
jgi:hypothetical protein